MSDEDLKAELERLRNENAALKKGASSSIRMKVSDKGALSVYGMGRFPVTLYKEQWLKLLDMSDDIRTFIAAHQSQLKAKDYPPPQPSADRRLGRQAGRRCILAKGKERGGGTSSLRDQAARRAQGREAAQGYRQGKGWPTP